MKQLARRFARAFAEQDALEGLGGDAQLFSWRTGRHGLYLLDCFSSFFSDHRVSGDSSGVVRISDPQGPYVVMGYDSLCSPVRLQEAVLGLISQYHSQPLYGSGVVREVAVELPGLTVSARTRRASDNWLARADLVQVYSSRDVDILPLVRCTDPVDLDRLDASVASVDALDLYADRLV